MSQFDYNELPMQAFARQLTTRGDNVYLRQPIGDDYVEKTWSEAYNEALRLANGFLALGLKPGDKVAILSENCAEWFLTDFAIMMAGLVSVPIYFTASDKTINYILEHSEAKAFVIGKLANTQPAEQALNNIKGSSIKIIGLPYPTVNCKYQYNDLVENNEPLSEVASPELEDTFSITYTSGSTGNPKGVVLTFKNIIYGGLSPTLLLTPGEEERVISYLPLAHITERALIQYSSLYVGSTVTFNHSLETFLRDLRSANPTFFISVPRLWMKFQSAVLANLPQKKLDLLLKIPVISGRVKHKIKTQLGLANVKSFGSGSAPIPASVLIWYDKLDIKIAEGWGMTELSGMATSQFPYRTDKLGSIGTPIEGLEIKISDEGELLIKGDAVFKEYYKNEEVTKETFTSDGYMKTGDKVDMDSDGYLHITGRVKDLFKSAKGKYVAPVPIESKLAINQYIDQICVMGSGLPKAIAVIVLSEELVKGLSRDEINESLLETVSAVNKVIEKHEEVGGVLIANEIWDVDNGLLTPTLKIKRAELEKKYADIIESQLTDKVTWQ